MSAGRLFLLVGVLSGVACGAEKAEQPNVLFIAIDDLRTELGCYGVTYADSPNLDRLAAQGVLFTNHFVQVPTCGASRYALLTGRSPRYSHALGNAAMYHGRTALEPRQLPGAQTLPELFRRSGYHTVCIGKISHTPDGKVFAYDGSGDGRPEMPGAWDELATPYGPWKRGWGVFFAYAGGRHREDGQGYRPLMEFAAQRDEDLPDGLMARRATEKLAELKRSGKPFFIGLGFYKPHLPFVATKGDWEAFAARDVPPPPHPDKPQSAYWHRSGEFYGYQMAFAKTYPLAPEDRITARRAYLACVRYVDRQVGKVLKALDDLQLSRSTIVIVWGDHGWHLGDSALWGKHTPFERALRSTLIIRAPGVSQAGLRCNALVETLDLYPTLVDLCQPVFRKTAYPLDGKSLRPLLTGQSRSIRSNAVSFWRSAVSVRTGTHRLIGSVGKRGMSRVELYDLADGPDPIRNRAASSPEICRRLLKIAALNHPRFVTGQNGKK